MIHLQGAPVRDAEPDQLIVGPEGAIEEEKVSILQPIEQYPVQAAASRNEGAGTAAHLIAKRQPNGVSTAGSGSKTRRAGGDLKRLNRDIAGPTVTIAKRHWGLEWHLRHRDLGKRLGYR